MPRRPSVCSAFLLVAIVACWADRPVRVKAAWVTGVAAAAVDSASGQFLLALPVGRDVSLLAADTLAVAVAHDFGDAIYRRAHWGVPLDVSHLHPCARATYSFSAVGELPPSVPGMLRLLFSSHWVIPVCGLDETAQLSIAIPDAPRNIRVIGGSLRFGMSGIGGMEFQQSPVTFRYPTGLPFTPEQAVQAVFERTGVRTTDIPTAYDQSENRWTAELAVCASWRVRLEHTVAVRSEITGATRQADELFVRRSPTCRSNDVAFFVPLPDQPTTFPMEFPKDTTRADRFAQRVYVSVPLVGPTRFERVMPTRSTRP